MKKNFMCFVFVVSSLLFSPAITFAQFNFNIQSLQGLGFPIPQEGINLFNTFQPVINQVINAVNSGDDEQVINTVQNAVRQNAGVEIPANVQNVIRNNIRNVRNNNTDPQVYIDQINTILPKNVPQINAQVVKEQLSNPQTRNQLGQSLQLLFNSQNLKQNYVVPTKVAPVAPKVIINRQTEQPIYQDSDYEQAPITTRSVQKIVIPPPSNTPQPITTKTVQVPVQVPVHTPVVDPNEGKSGQLTDLLTCAKIGTFSSTNYIFAKGISTSSKKPIVLIYSKQYIQKALDDDLGFFAPNINTLSASMIKQNMVGSCYRTDSIRKIDGLTCCLDTACNSKSAIMGNVYAPNTYIPSSNFGDCKDVLK